MSWTLWWKSALLGALVWLVLRVARRLSAAERFQVWLVYLLCLPLLAWTPVASPTVVLQSVAGTAVGRAVRNLPLTLPYYWLIAGLLAAWFLYGRFAAFGIWHRAVGDSALRYSDEISGPVASGVLRPRILLPIDAETWPVERLERVLAHERAHGERRDILWDLAGSLIVACCWLQPFAWLALRDMRREREWACDDRVIELGSDRIEYAQTLYEFAAESSLQPAMAGSGRGNLEERMKHLLNPFAPRRKATWLTATLATLTLVALACLVPRLSIAQDNRPMTKKWDKPPLVTQSVEPEYTQEAREQKVSGVVVLNVLVRTSGNADDFRVVRSLGHGLDEQAILAVQQWRFTPAEKDGRVIDVEATIEVNFRLK